jgi:hypothetical protein
MQCMAGGMTAVGAASGIRSYLGRLHAAWLTPRRLRRITIGLAVAALVASSLIVSGSNAPAARTAAPSAAHATAR